MQNGNTTCHDEGLIGRCFVIFGEDKTASGRHMVNLQGVIKAYLPGDRVLVQFYEPVILEEASLAIFPMSELEDGLSRGPGDWELFEDKEHLGYWMRDGHGRALV